jgi:nicotinate-nucleotide adenylyltransferase
MNLRYSIDSINRLKQAFDADFVFLIGADNLMQLHRWYRWQAIMHACPIAVFDRKPYSIGAGMSKAARCFAHARLQETDAASVVTREPPAWVFIHARPHPASSTEIRARRAHPPAAQRSPAKESKQ